MLAAVKWIVGSLWLAAIVGGLVLWSRFENTAGATGVPAEDAAATAPQWRLLAFAHPRCPCFRIVLHELESLHRDEPDLGLRVVFVRPAEAGPDWERGETWDRANALQGVEIAIDEDGSESKRFGAETSGQVVLVHPDGRIVFRGGLTRNRGMGDGPGLQAIKDWLRHGSGRAESPVFGCPLFTPAD